MSCTGKPKFSTEAAAQRALRRAVPGIQSLYLCQHCGKYHLGAKPAPRAPARRVRKAAHYARR